MLNFKDITTVFLIIVPLNFLQNPQETESTPSPVPSIPESATSPSVMSSTPTGSTQTQSITTTAPQTIPTGKNSDLSNTLYEPIG